MDIPTIFRVLSKRRELIRQEKMNRSELDFHVSGKLAELRDYAYRFSSFYRKFHKGLERAKLNELPILTKKTLMENYDDLVTDRQVRIDDVRKYLESDAGGGPFRNRYYVAATSGTSGHQGIFLYDEEEWNTIIASYDRANRWAGLKPSLFKKMKLAVVSSKVPWHQSSLVGVAVRSPWVPTLRLDATEPLGDINERLNRFQPHCLVGYAGMLGTLALEQLAGRLRIQPKAVLCSSEVLTGEARVHIIKAWGREPFNVYAATETAGIASECDCHKGLHFYEDMVIVETVDEANRPVEPGQHGSKLLVTVLFSRTLPLIRYELGDRVMVSQRTCTCGRTFRLVNEVEGRREDVLWFRDLKGNEIPVHPNVFHAIFEPLELAGWQVTQHLHTIRVRIVLNQRKFGRGWVHQMVLKALENAGVPLPRAEIKFVKELKKGPLGKNRLIVGSSRRKMADRFFHQLGKTIK